MLLASYLLAALAVLLAWPVPVMLARAAWPARSPAAAMVLWQGIALAGGLSMIGAFLCWGLAPLESGLLPAIVTLAHAIINGQDLPHVDLIHVFALSLAAMLFGHLTLTLIRSAWRLGRMRQRHREMLRFLSTSGTPKPGAATPGTVVIEHATPLAYCLPGAGSLTVLSSGLLESLTERELRAVLAHESAHLDQRHDLLLLAFTSWHDALPWLPTTRMALQAVGELIEELADDAALRTAERSDLLGALAVVATAGQAASLTGEPGRGAGGSNAAAASGPTPASPRGHGSPSESLTSGRLHRLLNPPAPLSTGAARLTMSVGALLVVIPTVCLVATSWGI
ncbi:M56 family metallopeptidase [Galactobacter caseinivorans]|uniref:M56 family peptidase n=1 Tax=Galactobacter caseinivorans TaxID=2676123 RepID=A0A496PMD5_9MICC|nr:M56 family metallopeptidase [Galactobacter caseinivorans]RKW71700.1 M56 family peptidase [Galactobacter caseinivorans]